MGSKHAARVVGAALAMAASALVLGSAPAGAATTTIQATGATITRSDATAGTTLTVKATVARLDLWCSSNKLVVNKKATTIPCDRLLSVTTTGLTGNDWVEINATGFGSALPKTTLAVKTGAGNDTINVRHNGTLTVYAGAGNDKIGAGLASGKHPVSETLLGEDGNDTLSNYGFITATQVLYDGTDAVTAKSKALGSTMRGGPGADTIVGDNVRWSDITFASNDTVNLKEGPALLSPDEGTGVAPSWTYQLSSGDPNNADTLTYGRATSLTVRCAAAGSSFRSTINGLLLPIPCAYHYLDVQGTARAETFDYDQNRGSGPNRYGHYLNVFLGGGNDVAKVRTTGGTNLEGGDGNDSLTAGFTGAGGEMGFGAHLSGGNGNDTITNLGFVFANPPAYDPDASYDYVVGLDGGPGVDRINGAATTIDHFQLDVDDTIVDPGGPAWARFTGTSGSDNVRVNGNGAAATTLDVMLPGMTAQKRITVPIAVQQLTVETLGGDDSINPFGRSKGTAVYADTGDGIDSITFRIQDPHTDVTSADGLYRTITQIGYQPVTWQALNVERVTRNFGD